MISPKLSNNYYIKNCNADAVDLAYIATLSKREGSFPVSEFDINSLVGWLACIHLPRAWGYRT